MNHGIWIIPAALIAAFLFVSTGCHLELKPTEQVKVVELDR